MARPQRLPKVINPVSGTGYEYLTPNQAAKVNSMKKISDQNIKAQQDIIDNALGAIQALNYGKAGLNPSSPTYAADVKDFDARIAKQRKIISDATSKIDAFETNLKENIKSALPPVPTFAGGGAEGNSVSVKPTDGAKTFTYKYNAPMVVSAYILNRPSKDGNYNNPQVESTRNDKLITSPATYTKNARNEAWQSNENGIAGSKGVIQMSSWLAARTKLSADAKKDKNFSTQMYGFKFLYNPTTVAMSWGVNTEVNFQLESLGLDKSVPLTGGLAGSTISFDLLLNRIGDMAHLTEYGLRDGIYDPITGKLFPSTNPYPTNVELEELQSIYKKGTMYDLEYLFRATNGYSAQYTSDIGGITADRGWLFALPVELILGDGMKYLVRITSMNVNHNIFNDRMVPVLSTISLTCTRYYDGAALAKFVTTSK
jgi:hypothetical protein